MMPEGLYRIAAAGEDGGFRIYDVEIDPSHAVFEGHFPDNPVLPGVCTLMMVRACASDALGAEMSYAEVKESKFLSAVIPGKHDRLTVKIRLGESDGEWVPLSALVLACGETVLKLKASLTGAGRESVAAKARRLGCAVVIPTYNNAGTLRRVVEEVRAMVPDVIVVNDGSTDGTAGILSGIEGIEVISYEENRGKGYALKTGLRRAAGEGFRYAVTIDSDGQHFPDDIPAFLDEAERHPDSLVIGARNLTQENMPSKNTFANRFSNFWFRLETGKRMQDTQSGFRLYPLEKMSGMRFMTSRYEFELESAVKLAWRGVRVANIPVGVHYAPAGERVSHFRPFRDFARISLLNAWLVIVAFLVYYPYKFIRWLRWPNIKRFIRDNITHSRESNLRLSLAIGLGIFWGIVPVWGYQMIMAGVTAHFLRLNKVICIVSANISLPPIIPFILYGSYATGGFVMNRPVTITFSNISFEAVGEGLLQYIVGSVVLAVAAGIAIGLLSYILLGIFRKTPCDG